MPTSVRWWRGRGMGGAGEAGSRNTGWFLLLPVWISGYWEEQSSCTVRPAWFSLGPLTPPTPPMSLFAEVWGAMTRSATRGQICACMFSLFAYWWIRKMMPNVCRVRRRRRRHEARQRGAASVIRCRIYCRDKLWCCLPLACVRVCWGMRGLWLLFGLSVQDKTMSDPTESHLHPLSPFLTCVVQYLSFLPMLAGCFAWTRTMVYCTKVPKSEAAQSADSYLVCPALWGQCIQWVVNECYCFVFFVYSRGYHSGYQHHRDMDNLHFTLVYKQIEFYLLNCKYVMHFKEKKMAWSLSIQHTVSKLQSFVCLRNCFYMYFLQ